MLHWEEVPAAELENVGIIFTDIDDTITTEGKILPEAFQALWDLTRAGFQVVPITGRCAGWVDHIARMWPVAGVVGENGAFYSYMDITTEIPKLMKHYFLPPQTVIENREKFERIKREVFAKFPEMKLASDQPYREFDLAIDFCEDVPRHTMEEVLQVVEIFERYGATTKISSIHVNGWFGNYDKLSMAKKFAMDILNVDIEATPKSALFIGDSPNDQPMFDFFPISVGVANILDFKQIITKWPKYITKQKSGQGFAEMGAILRKKRII